VPDRATAGTARRCFLGVEVVTVTQQHHQPAPTEQSGQARRNAKDRPAREAGQAGLVRPVRLAGICARTEAAKGHAGVDRILAATERTDSPAAPGLARLGGHVHHHYHLGVDDDLSRIEQRLAPIKMAAKGLSTSQFDLTGEASLAGEPNPIVRHYIYISPTKVDRLYNQIVAGPTTSPSASLEERLSLVLSSLSGQVGSIGSPARVFRGMMTMKHGVYPLHPEAEATVAMWLGVVDSGKTLVVLGGSASYLDGNIPHGNVNNSGEGSLFQAMALASLRPVNVFDADERHLGVGQRVPEHRLPGAWDSDAVDVWRSSTSSAVMVEFAAYWLSESVGDAGNGITRVIVGSPLYVSYGPLSPRV
jgi:hypothetical protein